MCVCVCACMCVCVEERKERDGCPLFGLSS